MLTNRFGDARVKQEAHQHLLLNLIQNRVADFEKSYHFTWPQLIELKLDLQTRIKSAPKSWNTQSLQDGIDGFIYRFAVLHGVPEKVRALGDVDG